MKKPLIILSAVLCMVLPSLSPAEMRQREPRQLAAAWQEVKKQIADDGKTIRVRDGIQARDSLRRNWDLFPFRRTASGCPAAV